MKCSKEVCKRFILWFRTEKCLLKRQTEKCKHSNSWSHKLFEVIPAKFNRTHVQSICQSCRWSIFLGRSWWIQSGLPKWFQVEHRNHCLEYFLLLLEGQTVHLARPKNEYPVDMCIQRGNTIFFFCCQQETNRIHWEIQYPWRKMSSRWHTFNFTHQIENAKNNDPCTWCFSKLVLMGAE